MSTRSFLPKQLKSYNPSHELKVFGVGGAVYNLTDKVTRITTKKDLTNPAGTFGFSLVPDLSLYRTFSPMDYAEIRFGRGINNKGAFTRAHYNSPHPKIIMRGFIRNVRRSFGMGSKDGVPSRSVVVDGQDYGMLLLITKIYYLKAVEPLTAILPELALANNFGLDLVNLTPTQFMSKIFTKFILDPTLAGPASSSIYDANRVGQFAKIQARLKNAPATFNFLSTVPDTEVSPNIAVQPFEGSIWNLLTHYDNSPWNELFVADDASQSYLVFRPTPWIEYPSSTPRTRNFIKRINPDGSDFDPDPSKMTNAYLINSALTGTPPSNVGASNLSIFQPLYITDDDLISEDLGRSDEEVVNYLFTFGTLSLLDRVAAQVGAGDTVSKAITTSPIKNQSDEAKHANPKLLGEGSMADVSLYGFRPKDLGTEYSADLVSPSTNQNTQFLGQRTQSDFYSNLNYWAVAAYQPNVLFENGTIKIKGNENAQVGTYLVNQTTDEYFYIVSVQHDYVILEDGVDFVTTLGVVRGDGFIHNANIKNGQTPWRTS